MAWHLGVIGGSGLYDLPGIEDGAWRAVGTPFGPPSEAVFTGRLHGVPVAFLPRHGRGHALTPSTVNYRANIWALRSLGVTDVLSLSACGGLVEDAAPGTFVIVDQFIDRTQGRAGSFFGPGLVAHVPMADPVCPRLAGIAAAAGRAAGAPVVEGGTYVAMEGPAFSTRAESLIHRGWGAHVVGMTNMPEARLAREAQMPYASVCMVTDYDAWRPHEAGVDVGAVLEVMHRNTDRARALVTHFVAALAGMPRLPSPIDTVLAMSVITAPERRDPAMLDRLAPLFAARG